MLNKVKSGFLVLLIALGCVRSASAQTATSWQWRVDGNIFAGGNYQYRQFTDFGTFESQNWTEELKRLVPTR